MQSQSIHEVKETCITLELSLSYLLQYPTCSTQLPTWKTSKNHLLSQNSRAKSWKCYKVELPYKSAVTEGKINSYLVIWPACTLKYGKDQFDPKTARLVPGRCQTVMHLLTRIKIFLSPALRIPHNGKLRLQIPSSNTK